MHALHAVHAMPDLRVAGGRLGDGVSVLMNRALLYIKRIARRDEVSQRCSRASIGTIKDPLQILLTKACTEYESKNRRSDLSFFQFFRGLARIDDGHRLYQRDADGKCSNQQNQKRPRLFLLSHQTQAHKPTRDGVEGTSVLDVRINFIDDPFLFP